MLTSRTKAEAPDTRATPARSTPAATLGQTTKRWRPARRPSQAHPGASSPDMPQMHPNTVNCQSSPSRTVLRTTQLNGNSATKAPRPML